MVRVITPQERFEADGPDHSAIPAAFDQCEYCWPKRRAHRSGKRGVVVSEDWAFRACVAGTFQATAPPDGATCDVPGCGDPAEVRVTAPKLWLETGGASNSHGAGTWDGCGLHWPRFRDATMHNGHKVVDTTGDLRRLVADFGGWTVFSSDGGRLYAASYGMTLYSWLVGPLRAEMQRVMVQATA